MEEQKTTNSVPINSELNIKLEDVIGRFAPPHAREDTSQR